MSDAIPTVLRVLLDPTSEISALMATKGGTLSYLASMFERCRAAMKERSSRIFVDEFEKRVKRLESRMDKEGIPLEEFYCMFLLASEAATTNARDEKIRLLARLLANLLLRTGDADKLPITEVEVFIRCVDTLSVEAIQLLGVLHRLVRQKLPQGAYQDDRLVNGHVGGGELAEQYPKDDPHLVMGLVSQLAAWNLVYTDLPGVRTIRNGWVTNQNIFLTPLGSRLVHFIMESPDQQSE